jgi:hypothetical protein
VFTPSSQPGEDKRMEAGKRAGRLIGVCIVIQMALGPLVNFVLEAPLFGPPGFLVKAVPHAQEIAVAVVLSIVMEALWLAMAVAAFNVFSLRAQGLALWFVALATVVLASAVLENVTVMSMVSLSEAYAAASAVQREQIETVRVVVASARNWSHLLARISDGCAIFSFNALLYRLAAVPRPIAGFGLVASLLMITGLGVALFGGDVVFPLLAPLGLSQLILAVWLLAKGFSMQS